ncbi:hypothetical protein [Bowmanella dokdonensis]
MLETLVAGFIMFLVIATTTMVYRGALLSSQKAQVSVELMQVVPFIMDLTELEIRQKSEETDVLNGQGKVLGIEYFWQARMESIGAVPPELDLSTGESVAQEARFKLWVVELQLSIQGRKQILLYKKVSW